MIKAIADVAAEKSINLFRRFDLMKRWNEVGRYSFELMVNPIDDTRLHQSEWSTKMVAEALRKVIVDKVKKIGTS
jgi:hypothetical protein